jgi:hypothetical protein
MEKLIDFWSDEDNDNLKASLSNCPDVFDWPEYEDVMNYLRETDADGDVEEVMDDLVIQFIDGEFWLDNC